MLSFKPAFLLSSFTFIKRFFSTSLLSGISVVSSAYLRLLIFLPAILLPAYASDVQQSDSVSIYLSICLSLSIYIYIHTHMCIYINICIFLSDSQYICSFSYTFPLWLITGAEYSSLFYTVGPCWLSVLYVLVYSC